MADRTQTNGRLDELARYSRRITAQLNNFNTNVNIVTDNIKAIGTVLITDLGQDSYEGSEVKQKITTTLSQYERIKDLINRRYNELAERIESYVQETRDNLEQALTEIDDLDRQIEEILSYFA